MGSDTTNPEHYKAEKLEAWDVLDEFFPNDPLLWNAGKYLMRLGKKDAPAQEIGKIKTYLDRWLEKRTKDEDENEECLLFPPRTQYWHDPETGSAYLYSMHLPDAWATEDAIIVDRGGRWDYGSEEKKAGAEDGPYILESWHEEPLNHDMYDRWAEYCRKEFPKS